MWARNHPKKHRNLKPFETQVFRQISCLRLGNFWHFLAVLQCRDVDVGLQLIATNDNGRTRKQILPRLGGEWCELAQTNDVVWGFSAAGDLVKLWDSA